jgi:hypothetical protein
MTFGHNGLRVNDWLVAPLSWRLRTDTEDWLLPARQLRGLHVPASWLFSGAPSLRVAPDSVEVASGDQTAASYSYWYDDMRERHYLGAESRAGGELLLESKLLEPHLSAGASLVWTATLTVYERNDDQGTFQQPKVAGSWIFGGSRMAWRRPWLPPTPGT